MLRDITPATGRKTIRQARALRRIMSLPGVLLWQVLRSRPHGLKFRRQHPAGAFVLDFWCADARLAVEVDGRAHDDGARAVRDRERDAWLGQNGITTLRIPASEVLQDTAAVADAIAAHARARLPLGHPAAAQNG
ncbi:DUF559 domain-containing protein [Altererythrobacter xixiisoli]|uniref:DUF559 domain-containing protein n=1 Tax=Croceibacterium xixiisoli TaxID=1476466 RepID=A0A6I4TW82_9SPHN|nr:endonuclease domain-containing protein [Croceibacterium xixiisoli]MXO99469.1 DUF559 domain-containing protein [Croceibacterium xixiisoli]